MKLTSIEKETIILYNEAEDTVAIMTYDKQLIATLKEFSKENPDVCKLKKHECCGISTTIKKKYLEVLIKK